MTDKQQIEELRKFISQLCCTSNCDNCKWHYVEEGSCLDYFEAKALYNAGYRKVDAGLKIICENEYDKFMGKRESYKRVLELQANEIERLYQIKLDLEHQLTQKGLTEYVGADVIAEEARKETAKEIFKEVEFISLRNSNSALLKELEKFIKERFGVEVEV